MWVLPDAPVGLTPLTPAVPTTPTLPLVKETEVCSFVGDGSPDSSDGRRPPSSEDEVGGTVTWYSGPETEWGDAEEEWGEPLAGGIVRAVATDERRWVVETDPICKGSWGPRSAFYRQYSKLGLVIVGVLHRGLGLAIHLVLTQGVS